MHKEDYIMSSNRLESSTFQDNASNSNDNSTETGNTTTDCAWCLQEANQEPGEGSHGICESHALAVYTAYRAARATR